MAKPVKKKQMSILEQFKESESSASIVFGAIVVIVAGLLIFNFVKSNKEAALLPESEATESASLTTPLANVSSYVVVKGDTLWSIAEKKYGSGYNWVDIAKENNLKPSTRLDVGATLKLPAVQPRIVTKPETMAQTAIVTPQVVSNGSPITGATYSVQKGDCLWDIAVRAYGDGYKWTSIYQANKTMIKHPNSLYVGWELSLPR
jgi:nucleoid-associated protein YgaU